MDSSTSQRVLPTCGPDVKIEAAHLEGLLPDFAVKTDIVLYTIDGGTNVETELPAHADVLSKHSNVLSEIVTACKDTRILMMGDSLSEVKAMLTLMYRPATAAATMTSGQLLAALAVTYKYGMKQEVSEAESRLVANVKHAAHSSFTDHDTADNIITYAVAGEKFKLQQLRAYSEAYIAVNLENLGGRDLPLSGHSLARMAVALAQRFKSARADIADLVTAAESSKERIAEYETVIIDAITTLDENPDCPSTGCKGQLLLCKVSKRRREVRCNAKRCRWAVDYQPVIPRPREYIIDSKAFLNDLLKLLLSK